MSSELEDKLINVTAKGIKELGLRSDYFTTTLPNGTLGVKIYDGNNKRGIPRDF